MKEKRSQECYAFKYQDVVIERLRGDAILAEFKDADSVQQCAIDVQVALKQWNTSFHINQLVFINLNDGAGAVVEPEQCFHRGILSLRHSILRNTEMQINQ